jgi:glycosyltransferase involved in cell wall biosynthesis
MIVNIISSNKGGGAELLVRELHRIYLSQNLNAQAVYSTGCREELGENETIIGLNPRNPRNITCIRKILKQFSARTEGELIVHVNLTWPLLYTTLASIGLRNVRLIYTEHNTSNRRRGFPILRYFERIIYTRYERIICISDGVKSVLAQWVGPRIADRLVTVPNGSRIYSRTDRSTLDGRFPRLISIGSLSHRKNFATAIRAVAHLKNELDSYTIIGEGPERNRLEKIIRDEGLEDKVRLIGWSDEIETHLHFADLQLIPSLWEGFGLVAVEGMSTGLSVVASDVAGLREVLDSNNLAVTLVEDLKSADAWVCGLKVAIDNWRNEDPEKLSGAARTQAEKFTLEAMAERYLEVYRSLL